MDKNQSYPDGSPANRFSSWIRQLVWMQKCKIRVHRKLYRAEGAPCGCVKRPSQLPVGVEIVLLRRIQLPAEFRFNVNPGPAGLNRKQGLP